jgi:hypothetical protein
MTPSPPPAPPPPDGTAADRLVLQAFARLDTIALGVAVGCVGALGVSLATAVLLVKGGQPVGPTLALLSQFFPGYRVTWPGALVGAAYGFASGFVLGWLFAFVRNAIVAAYLRAIRSAAQLSAAQTFLDDI